MDLSALIVNEYRVPEIPKNKQINKTTYYMNDTTIIKKPKKAAPKRAATKPPPKPPRPFFSTEIKKP